MMIKHISIRRKAMTIVESIPRNGCVLVFNGCHSEFRKIISELYRGILKVEVCERGDKYAKERNLYISWRE